MLEALEHSLIETLNILPVLFVVYFVVNMISHSENFNKIILKSQKFGPVIASALGVFPQCGFSSAMADMYSKKYITIGSLFAVFIATSDEAFAVLLAYPDFAINLIILIAVKFISAVIIGYAIDFIMRKKVVKANESLLSSHHCHCNILVETIKESLQVAFYLFVATFIINYVLSIFSLETNPQFVSSNIFLQPIITAAIGLIPNCASSVLLVRMYMDNIIHFGSLVGGLSAGSGVGILVLFKNNKNIKENILILLSMFLIGVVLGIIINLVYLFI